MITVVKQGEYRLIETKGQTKILTLDNDHAFAWVMAAEIGEILVTSYNTHITDHLLATGKYKLYEVEDEPHLTDLQHLELAVGNSQWQGYLLPTGLPNAKDKRNRIIPTNEIIA